MRAAAPAPLTAIFTPGYAAAEQMTSAKEGPWSDIYSVGASMYACIAGSAPLSQGGTGGLPGAIAVYTASYLAGYVAIFAPGGINFHREIVDLLPQGKLVIGGLELRGLEPGFITAKVGTIVSGAGSSPSRNRKSPSGQVKVS